MQRNDQETPAIHLIGSLCHADISTVTTKKKKEKKKENTASGEEQCVIHKKKKHNPKTKKKAHIKRTLPTPNTGKRERKLV